MITFECPCCRNVEELKDEDAVDVSYVICENCGEIINIEEGEDGTVLNDKTTV